MTTRGRDITKVIADVLAVTPPDETVFRAELERTRADVPYTPPECLQECWQRGAYAFLARFGDEPPKDGWGAAAFAIWMGT